MISPSPGEASKYYAREFEAMNPDDQQAIENSNSPKRYFYFSPKCDICGRKMFFLGRNLKEGGRIYACENCDSDDDIETWEKELEEMNSEE